MAHFILLVIEFIDELIFGVTDAAWSLIRTDLGLSYAQIGLALSLPGLISNFIEPFLFILGDVWRRRTPILIGGLLFAVSLILTAISQSFGLFFISFILFNPSSGMFVSLSQATLMDSAPDRHEQNMARWTFAGSLGVVAGPFLLGGLTLLAFGWALFWHFGSAHRCYPDLCLEADSQNRGYERKISLFNSILERYQGCVPCPQKD
jgi:MFS transporter, FSR family, fosmidomycin resistance protein